jgi:hypothetical protein
MLQPVAFARVHFWAKTAEPAPDGGAEGDRIKVVTSHRVITCSRKTPTADVIWPQAVLQLPLHVSQWRKAMRTVQHLLSQISDGTWQDLTLSAGNIFFCITLIPMLRQPGRPPLLTCIPTGLALIAGGFVFASLHLWLTALTQTIAGLQWLALGFKSPPEAASSLSENSKRSFDAAGWTTMVRQPWSHARRTA